MTIFAIFIRNLFAELKFCITFAVCRSHDVIEPT